MSLTSYRAALPRARVVLSGFFIVFREISSRLSRSGGDLLSHVLRRSTIGAAALNGRVRDGIGCFARARATRPGKRRSACPLRGVMSKDALEEVLLLPDQIKPIEPLVPVN
jgi:hypothetical protein